MKAKALGNPGKAVAGLLCTPVDAERQSIPRPEEATLQLLKDIGVPLEKLQEGRKLSYFIFPAPDKERETRKWGL